MKKEDVTTIQVSREVKGYLASQTTRKGETYEQILRRLLSKLGVKFTGGDKQPMK